MPKRTGRPWQRKKARIIRRDNGICHLCDRPGADSADHLIPAEDGGPEAEWNLKAVHHDVFPKCNRLRGSRSVEYGRLAAARAIEAADLDAGSRLEW